MPRVLMAGLPGTGKSTLAAHLANALQGIVLNKDVIRAAVFPEPFVEYSIEQDELVMDLMLAAAAWLEQRHPSLWIFFDGRTFSRRAQRARVAAAYTILCACPEELAERRLANDTSHPARNRDFALYQRVRAQFEPIDGPHWIAETSRPLADLLAEGLRYLKG